MPGRTCFALACLLLGLAPVARAAHTLTVSAGSVEWSGIVARQVSLVIDLDGPAAAVRASAGQVRGIAATGPMSSLRLDCRRLAASAGALDCARGSLSGRFGNLGMQQGPFSFALRGEDDVHARLPDLALAGGRASLELTLTGHRWHAATRFADVDLGRLAALPVVAEPLPAGITLGGRTAGSAEVSGSGLSPRAVQAKLGVEALEFANEAGTLAGEKLAAGLEVTATRPAAGDVPWSFEATLSGSTGQAYLDPVFVDVGAHPLQATVAGSLDVEGRRLTVTHFDFRQREIVTAQGSLQLDATQDAPLRAARVHVADLDLATAVPVYVLPFLLGTQFQRLQAAGHVTGVVDVDDGRPSHVDLELHDVALDSMTGSLTVDGLGGRFRWFDEQRHAALASGASSADFASQVGWHTLTLWGIESGPVTVPFTTTGNNFRLLEPVTLPIFDGGLAIGTLRVRNAGTPDMYLRFDAELKPVSMRLLTRALGWPEFGGTLAGSIPRLQLSHGEVTLGGDIVARVFDGTVTVHNLRLREPLGHHPQLFADIDAEQLDLERVTGTFEFGMITGRLSGTVKGLEMFDWMPVAFDARFQTPPGDRSPHRISQRAITNLSSIGGGSGGSVAAALQGGFLRFFKSFRYARLGLSCRLANDVCSMDGVAPAPTGYYIVKGTGLPRVDVIGNQRQVAWTRLVRQLAAIMQSSGPVVQ